MNRANKEGIMQRLAFPGRQSMETGVVGNKIST
jgi:hypothetical protein